MSGRGAGAVSSHTQREGGVFQVPGAAAENPACGQGGSVHLHPRYTEENLEYAKDIDRTCKPNQVYVLPYHNQVVQVPKHNQSAPKTIK